MTTYVFNWHEAERDSYLYWLIPTLLGPLTKGKAETFSDLTDKFKQVELGMTINGVAVDPKGLIDSIERNYDYHVARRAQEIIEEIGMDDLVEFLTSAQAEVIKLLRQKLATKGIKMEDS